MRTENVIASETVKKREPGADTDAEFIELIRAGDAFAWREMVRQYEPALRRTARRYRLSDHDAQDAVQVTWVRCLEHIDQLAQANRLRAWLVTICSRECLRIATRGQREAPIGETAVTSLIDSTQETQDPSAEAERHDDIVQLKRAIAALSDRQRSVLIELLGRDDCSYLDISGRLGLPVGSIGPTWQRALTRLRRDPELAKLRRAS